MAVLASVTLSFICSSPSPSHLLCLSARLHLRSSPACKPTWCVCPSIFCCLGATRTKDARELLYARQKVVVTTKAFGLQAIDLVYIDYKDVEGLRRQAREGALMGFTGKVPAIWISDLSLSHWLRSPQVTWPQHVCPPRIPLIFAVASHGSQWLLRICIPYILHSSLWNNNRHIGNPIF